MQERDWTRVLGWPGYQVYEKEIDEPGKKLKLWVRRKKVGLKLICSGCGQACAGQQNPRDQRAGGTGPALLRVLDDSGGGDVSDEVPPLRGFRAEKVGPVAEQGAL